jgi:type IV pilus assembly protein PilB
MTARIRLGDLLVSSNVVTEAQVSEALAKQKETGKRLGETLVSLGYVTELEVAQTLSHQLSVPWVNLQRVDFSRELLNLVSAEIAVSSRVVPVYVRRVRQQGEVLFVATDDPLNDQALLAVAAHVGMPVKAMVMPGAAAGAACASDGAAGMAKAAAMARMSSFMGLSFGLVAAKRRRWLPSRLSAD